mmetsp:Transcript_6773/g.11163  ORF Transcript_6773/g.11163 Transcript_6773/m.11163 type:complete len:107 (-) Transcript_6773:899-1219(-)
MFCSNIIHCAHELLTLLYNQGPHGRGLGGQSLSPPHHSNERVSLSGHDSHLKECRGHTMWLQTFFEGNCPHAISLITPGEVVIRCRANFPRRVSGNANRRGSSELA